jgi:hypothetical protein
VVVGFVCRRPLEYWSSSDGPCFSSWESQSRRHAEKVVAWFWSLDGFPRGGGGGGVAWESGCDIRIPKTRVCGKAHRDHVDMP